MPKLRDRFSAGTHQNIVFSDEKIFTVEKVHNNHNDRILLKIEHPSRGWNGTENDEACLSHDMGSDFL